MKQSSLIILRVGLGITFFWIGILIIRDPQAWGTYIQPWAANLLPIPVAQAMIATAILDIVVGLLLIIGAWVWVAALLGSIHLVVVLITVGVDGVTVRDIGLLAGTIALMNSKRPSGLRFWKR